MMCEYQQHREWDPAWRLVFRKESYGLGSIEDFDRSSIAWRGITTPCDITALKAAMRTQREGALEMTFVSFCGQMTAGNAIENDYISGILQMEPPVYVVVAPSK